MSGYANRTQGFKAIHDPIYVRAIVISDGTRTVAFADNETQGSFAAYKKGPWGHTDSRKTIEAATGGPNTGLEQVKRNNNEENQ